ncbi:GNAT family N-acetyltransferase [Pseudalkalibacillus sp. SCS-8]|uniref:GNAT family N-acetyltransferase n=1 Tax=Pseudalkalibacillus nanhaiensis TaxID=3115291 RepID=UPI0032DAC867
MFQQSADVDLCPYSPDYDQELNDFYLPEDQLQFTAYPKEMIEMACKDASRNPVVILSEGKPIGFFVLQSGERVKNYTDKNHCLLLIAFSIDTKYQGKGFAKLALEQLSDYVNVHFPDVQEIVLAVNERNRAAQKLYLKCGFEDHGVRRMGKIGMQLVLTCSV